MPYDTAKNLSDFTDCLGALSAIVEENEVESVFLLGDFNAHPGESFFNELTDFSAEQNWICSDIKKLGLNSGTYTYISEAHGSGRWLDHCVVTEAAWKLIIDSKVLYDTYWSDHFPLITTCNFNLSKSKFMYKSDKYNSVKWGARSDDQIRRYQELCNQRLKLLDFPELFAKCCFDFCHDFSHRNTIDKFYNEIVSTLSSAASEAYSITRRRKNTVTGWNKHVKDAHMEARSKFSMWTLFGRPKHGTLYDAMVTSRKIFKGRLKWCQNNQEQIRMDALATLHARGDFGRFWKSTNNMNVRPGLPVSVDGVNDAKAIADIFKDHFTVKSPLGPSSRVLDSGTSGQGHLTTHIKAKTIDSIIKSMSKGKSPGHDGLSIEHLRHAGVHLPRVLALLFNMCLVHSYLPAELMKTIVVPIIKNKTGDISDRSNYRPISLATVIAKVLDRVLNSQLEDVLSLHDGQHGFKRGLSTESAILSLKHTVKYYTDRHTPVYACFLDLSKAFDLVSYDLLWDKLERAGLSRDVLDIFKCWYGGQVNSVRWADEFSEPYRMECGVRQGGLISPNLFSLYVNELIEGLSSTRIGCHIGNVCVNNISYADDMVLLAPSVSALRKLLKVCESYAGSHGLL
ncbi:hypothetical protein ABMA27_005292 [Loxostege sticticalis]|uniref:Reverse transcriptase domain-containing protein n=1 Tax=Loxostege sticticalis TaxID=481309 RepID=A0ABR3HIM3_LOXSC